MPVLQLLDMTSLLVNIIFPVDIILHITLSRHYGIKKSSNLMYVTIGENLIGASHANKEIASSTMALTLLTVESGHALASRRLGGPLRRRPCPKEGCKPGIDATDVNL